MTSLAHSHTSAELYDEMMKVANENAVSQGQGNDGDGKLLSRRRVKTFIEENYKPAVSVSTVEFDFKGTRIAVQKFCFADILKFWMGDLLRRDEESFGRLNFESKPARAGFIGSAESTRTYRTCEKKYCFDRDGHRIAYLVPVLGYADGTHFDNKGVCKGTIVRFNTSVFPWAEFDTHWEDAGYIQNLVGFTPDDKSEAYHKALEHVFEYEFQRIADAGGITYVSATR